MARLAALLSLIAALAGTPLRQAEAASDFGRECAEPAQADGLEAPDGGVGDDAGEAVLTAAAPDPAADAAATAVPLFLPPPAAVPARPDAASPRAHGHVWRPPDSTRPRHAWLQTFLF